MPDSEIYANLHLTAIRVSAQFVKKCVGRWKELFAELKTQFQEADLKLGLFKEPPYFGASFIDWERPDGKIHVSPYIWNVAAPNCPGYDLAWIGKQPSPIYETYDAGLQYLQSHTINDLTK